MCSCVSDFSFADVSVVAVQAWVGKEFPDTGNFRRERVLTTKSRDNVGTASTVR